MYHEKRKPCIKNYCWYKPSIYKLLQVLSTENTSEFTYIGTSLQKAETLRNSFVIHK